MAKVRTIADNDLAGTPLERALGAIEFGPMRYTAGDARSAGILAALRERARVRANVRGPEYEVPTARRLAYRVWDFLIPAQDMMKAARERGYVGLDLEKIMLTSGSYRERAILHMRSQPRDPRTLQFVAGGRPLLSIAQEMIDKVGERINWKRTQLPSGEKMGAFHIVNAIMVAKRVVERYDAV